MIDETKVLIVGGGSSDIKTLLDVISTSPSIVLCEPTGFNCQVDLPSLFDAPPALYCARLNIPESNQASAHRSRSGKHKSKSKHASPYGV